MWISKTPRATSLSLPRRHAFIMTSMRVAKYLGCLSVALVAACSSADEGSAPPGPSVPGGFEPPAVPAGYTRLVAPVVKDIAPGQDATICQYVRAPADEDIDILDTQGFQSTFGHHAVAYASNAAVPVGTSGPCTDTDNGAIGSFLGGVGGEIGGGNKLPDGVAYRLKKGSSILLNSHFVNTGKTAVDGHSVLDIKFAKPDPSRKIASLFTNGPLTFQIGPNAKVTATGECVLPRDFDFIMYGNHMHEHGSAARSSVLRAGSPAMELMHDDATWTYEMQFRAEFTYFPVDAPLHVAAGDTLRTDCEWQNTTSETLGYPREMCFGVGYFLSDGSSSPVCINGTWRERN